MFGWDDIIAGGIGLATSAMSSASSIKGIEMQNAANAQQAQLNRDFQERMANTAHTREVADLRNAGLNPILSATGGSGAASPGGSMAVMQNTMEQAAPMMANSAKNAADLLLTKALIKTEETKQNVNAKTAAKLGGTIPGTDIPIDRAIDSLRHPINSAKSLWNNITKSQSSAPPSKTYTAQPGSPDYYARVTSN